jgi:hypothetical protein
MAFTDARMSQAQVLEWFHCFKDGQITVKTDKCPDTLTSRRIGMTAKNLV